MLKYLSQASQSWMVGKLTRRPEKICKGKRNYLPTADTAEIRTGKAQQDGFPPPLKFTIMKTNVMVMKMLARPTTLWSAEMAMVMAVAV